VPHVAQLIHTLVTTPFTERLRGCGERVQVTTRTFRVERRVQKGVELRGAELAAVNRHLSG
jgi:hypothetical protein